MVAVYSSGLGEGGFAQMEAERLSRQRQMTLGRPDLYAYPASIDIGRGGFQVLEAERLLRQIGPSRAYNGAIIGGGFDDLQNIGIAAVVGLVAGFVIGKATK